ncbi:MAG: hypothetical protein WD875_17490 [Pirellulales bacterium]
MDQLNLNLDVAHDQLTEQLLHWLMRRYETQEAWKEMAQDVFMRSNGDAALSRCRVAAIVRRYCMGERTILRSSRFARSSVELTTGHDDEPVPVTASNAGYVDWLYVADYLLLRCAALSDEYVDENKQREAEFQQLLGSYELRCNVYRARKTIRDNPGLVDADILDAIKLENSSASLANVREARRQERANIAFREPIKPEKPRELERYKPVYF